MRRCEGYMVIATKREGTRSATLSNAETPISPYGLGRGEMLFIIRCIIYYIANT